jgi:RNA polymerase sigma-70 factor, ECF subfamily
MGDLLAVSFSQEQTLERVGGIHPSSACGSTSRLAARCPMTCKPSSMSRAGSNLDSAAVFDEYRDRIHRHILFMVRDPELAADLTQETFLRAHEELASLQDPSALSVWLYRIATRLCLDAYRSSKKKTGSAGGGEGAREDGPAPEPGPSLQLLVDQAEMSACVRGLLDELPPSYRAVLLLHDLHGMSGHDIADQLQCTLATAKIRLHRARRRLEAALRASCEFACDERGVLACEPKRRRRPPSR